MIAWLLLGGVLPALADPITGELEASTTFLMTGGNVERLVSQSRATWALGVHDRFEWAAENSYRFGQNSGRVIENDLLSRHYLRGLPSHRVYPFALASAERNLRRSIDVRAQVGAGMAGWLLDGPGGWVRASLAVVGEHTRYGQERFNLGRYDGDDRVRQIRALGRLGGRHRLADGRLEVRHDHRVMVSAVDPANVALHSLLVLRAPLVGPLSLRGEVDTTYESLVVAGANPFGGPTRTYDWVVTVGIDVVARRRSPPDSGERVGLCLNSEQHIAGNLGQRGEDGVVAPLGDQREVELHHRGRQPVAHDQLPAAERSGDAVERHRRLPGAVEHELRRLTEGGHGHDRRSGQALVERRGHRPHTDVAGGLDPGADTSDEPDGSQLPQNQALAVVVSDAERRIEAFLRQADAAGRRGDLEASRRVFVDDRGHHVGQQAGRDLGRAGQHDRLGGPGLRGLAERGGELTQQVTGARRQAPTLRSGPDPSRGSLEQRPAHQLLERTNAPAGGRQVGLEHARSRGKGTPLDRVDECFQQFGIHGPP